MYITFDKNGVSKDYKHHAGNMVMYSVLNHMEASLFSKAFSIKYVAEGVEQYRYNGIQYNLHGGDFLISNGQHEGTVRIDHPVPVKGICIELEKSLISEGLASFYTPDTCFPDAHLDKFFHGNDFMQLSVTSRDGQVAAFLHNLYTVLRADPYDNHIFEKEFYHQLTEYIISDSLPVLHAYKSIHTVKSSTKKELLLKLKKGRAFMDDHYTSDIDIQTVARECHISEYHFFRLFKNAYGISPYQYIKNKRMELARQLLCKENMRISELSQMVGYSDIFTFSKAFKRHFGHAPSLCTS